jgi:transposase InsO family protein
VDDFSRFTWVFLMRNKSETQTLLRQFFHYVHTQFNTKVQKLRSDNGAEFLSLKIFFLEEGVLFQHSCVYTPQQNGVVERKHRHILKTARALHFQSHLPITFWGECILSAVHIINRLSTLLLHKKTPFEILYNKLPDYSRMRVFGCVAFATIVNPSSKFSPRATKCIFLGYPMGQKA